MVKRRGREASDGAKGNVSARAHRSHTPDSSTKLIGVLELAARLGTSERFVRRLVFERRVPFHKVGKYVRFDPRDIDAWLSTNRIDPR